MQKGRIRANKRKNSHANSRWSPGPRNDKALNNQGFVGTNMAEAMGFELMDLLQSTVFKTCGRHHQGKYDAGHYRTVGSNPALRFKPLNCHRQCSPCNTQLSWNIVNYRIALVKRIGAEAVDWLEGPHEAKKYTVEDLKAMTADYRAKTRELKGRAA